MEGMLWKWTNYFSGWQLRWFVLEEGILSYYKSKEDVINGCKGSVKVSACNVSVHPSDSSRLDLIIPGEAHFYVKASSPQERQQWLVALGSAKASLTPSPLPLHTSQPPPDEERLRVKKSELRLYNDLLMQQVHSVKTAVQSSTAPDIQVLNEATSLLAATCDTFIKTLDECVTLANAKLSVSSLVSESTNGNKGDSPAASRASMVSPWSNQSSITRLKSSERLSGGSRHPSGSNERVRVRTLSLDEYGHTPSTLSNGLSTCQSNQTPPTRADDVFLDCNGQHDDDDDDDDDNEKRLPTYLSNLNTGFSDIRLTTELEIPTIPFLDACRSILPIIDMLNENAFVPAKLDIVGNIKKVHQKYLSEPDKFVTLQKIIVQELSLNQCQLTSSATMALLWLTRSLQFINGILEGLQTEEDDLKVIVNNSYSRTLRDFHGWVIKSAFAMAVRSVPSKERLLRCFLLDENDWSHSSFLRSLNQDLSDQSVAISAITSILHSFLVDHSLNFPDQV